MSTTAEPVEKLVYSIEEVAALLDVGLNTAYSLAKKGEIPTMRFGRLLKVPRRAFHLKFDAAGPKAEAGR